MATQVVATSLCKCAFGTVPVPLAAQNATVMACGLPAATIMDKMLPSFGMCSNPANPAVAAATAAALGVLTPQPCTPLLTAPWAPGSATVMIGGKLALNNQSTLCAAIRAGVITITSSMANTVMVP